MPLRKVYVSMRMSKIFIGLLILLNMSFGLDRCDVYEVFLDACANFGVKGGNCDDFGTEINKIVNSYSKSTKLFIDTCIMACKTGGLNKDLSHFGVNTFVNMCKLVK